MPGRSRDRTINTYISTKTYRDFSRSRTGMNSEEGAGPFAPPENSSDLALHPVPRLPGAPLPPLARMRPTKTASGEVYPQAQIGGVLTRPTPPLPPSPRPAGARPAGGSASGSASGQCESSRDFDRLLRLCHMVFASLCDSYIVNLSYCVGPLVVC